MLGTKIPIVTSYHPNWSTRATPDFIEANVELIMDSWVAFARKCQPESSDMDLLALRDHATIMLGNFVADMRRPQTAHEQHRKSEGNGVRRAGHTGAAHHGAGRASQGFSTGEMVAEFRALRASVIRLFHASHDGLSSQDLDDLVRFNEAVDQALAESVTTFTRDVNQSRDMLVAVLSHDLRTPLGTVLMITQSVMDRPDVDGESKELMGRAVRSAARMSRMIDDLLDFKRSRHGAGIGISRSQVNLTDVLRQAVEEMEHAHAGCRFDLDVAGDLHGHWDGPRLVQVLVNLLGNAVQHGDTTRPIGVSVTATEATISISVYNFGPAIPAADIPGLFGPFKRLKLGAEVPANAHNLGLGLYIVDCIVQAHDGSIDVASSPENGTQFTVTLPR